MKIQDILYINAILIDCKAAPKNEVLDQMGRFLASIHNVKDPPMLVQKIIEREAEISTGIGFGIAIPHARTNLVQKVCMVAARCVSGIEFNAIDEKPVHLIYMLAAPADNSDVLRNILSSLSKIMSYEDMREKLITANDAETFLNLIIEGENKYVSE